MKNGWKKSFFYHQQNKSKNEKNRQEKWGEKFREKEEKEKWKKKHKRRIRRRRVFPFTIDTKEKFHVLFVHIFKSVHFFCALQLTHTHREFFNIIIQFSLNFIIKKNYSRTRVLETFHFYSLCVCMSVCAFVSGLIFISVLIHSFFVLWFFSWFFFVPLCFVNLIGVDFFFLLSRHHIMEHKTIIFNTEHWQKYLWFYVKYISTLFFCGCSMYRHLLTHTHTRKTIEFNFNNRSLKIYLRIKRELKTIKGMFCLPVWIE